MACLGLELGGVRRCVDITYTEVQNLERLSGYMKDATHSDFIRIDS